MGRKSRVIQKPYRVVLEASHFDGQKELDRWRSLKGAKRFAFDLVVSLTQSIEAGAVGVAWVRTRVYCGPHLISTFEPLAVE